MEPNKVSKKLLKRLPVYPKTPDHVMVQSEDPAVPIASLRTLRKNQDILG